MIRIFCFIILSSVCLQITQCYPPTKTSFPPTMEPYNETHLKVYFENSFEGLPEQYVAVLSLIQPENPRPRVRAIINNSFVKSGPCDMMEDNSRFFVEIFTEERKDILMDTEPLIQSEGFQYSPYSNSIKGLIEDHVCALNSEKVRIDIAEIRKNHKYLEYCLLRIKINNVTITGTEGEKKEIQIEKEKFLVETVFSDDKPKYVTMEKKDLENCSKSGSNTIPIIPIGITILVLLLGLSGGVALKYFSRKEKKETILNDDRNGRKEDDSGFKDFENHYVNDYGNDYGNDYL